MGFWYADNCGHKKLVDYLSPSQFDLLVSVLRLLAIDRDFKALLTPESIHDVIKHLDEHSNYMFLHSYFIIFSSVNCIKTPRFIHIFVLMPETNVFLVFIWILQDLGTFVNTWRMRR